MPTTFDRPPANAAPLNHCEISLRTIAFTRTALATWALCLAALLWAPTLRGQSTEENSPAEISPAETPSPVEPSPSVEPSSTTEPATAATTTATAAAPTALEVDSRVLAAESDRIAAVAKATRAAVAVFDVGNPGGGGSAVVISPDGYALTNFHVVQPVGAYMKGGMEDGQLYDAVLVGIDPTGDVALIKLLGRDDFPTAEIGNSDTVQAGDWCFAVGNPFLLAHDFRPTVTFGIVSGVHRYQEPAGTLLEYADCIQTDAAINPGNSGGPLFNAQGQLIGINGRGSFEKRGRVNVGVGYAISINQIMNFLGHLKSGRIVDHATWGATVATDDEGRVTVTNILPSSDAYRRGIRYGDQIVSFGGRTITSANDLKNILGTFPQGWRIPVTYVRDGDTLETTIRLTGVHAREELLELVSPKRMKPERDGRPRGPRDKDHPQDESPDGQPEPTEPDQDQDPDQDKDVDKDADQKPTEEGAEGQKPAESSDGKTPYGEKLPTELAAVFEARYGFSNYYFNRIARDRLWNVNNQRQPLGDRHGPWVLSGRDAQANSWQATLNDDGWSATFGGNLIEGKVAGEGSDKLLPEGSGGLLWAWHQWRRWLVFGPERFGDSYYLGIEPVPGTDRQMHVIVATADTYETRFGFDTQTDQLISVIFSMDEETDPCELKPSAPQAVGADQIPVTWDVWWGDKHYGTLTVEAFSAAAKE
ncbi:MAG: trypsin-like peptidase domain-containing protein [Pirellulales bacterium]